MSADYSFMKGGPDAPSLHTDLRLATLAACVADQQAAGFKGVIDLREAKCRCCGASGFNTGFGFWRFACGAEVMPDGDECEPCPTATPQ